MKLGMTILILGYLLEALRMSWPCLSVRGFEGTTANPKKKKSDSLPAASRSGVSFIAARKKKRCIFAFVNRMFAF